MLAVSNAFNEAFKSDLREVKMRIKIKDVTYTDEDIVSFNYNSGSIVGDSFAIGSTYANTVRLTLCRIVEGLKQLDEVIPEMGIVLPNGSTEFVKLGTFIISEQVNPDRNENRTSIECTDKMIMLDDPYESKLSYPAKIRDVALEIANLAGVEVDKVSFGRLMENTIKKPEGYTFRQALGLIAQFEAGYVCFDRDGLLAIKTLEDENYEVTPAEYFQKGLVKNELLFRPAGIQVKVNSESEDEKVLKIGNEKGSVIRLENKVMTEQLLRLVYEKVKDINYYPYSLNWRGNPAVEVGDWLRVTDLKGNQFKIPNLSFSLEYKGGLTATSTVETVASNEVRYGYKTILEQTIEYVENAIKDVDGNVIYYGVEAPPNPKEGDTWFKYVDSDTEIWVYEKVGEPDVFDWVFKISSEVDDSIKEKIDELEQQSKDQQINIDKALSDAEKAREEAEVARQEAFDSSTIAKQAEKDALDALLKGDQNSTQITTLEGQQKLTNTKVEGNTANILNLQADSEKLSLSIGKVQADVDGINVGDGNDFPDSERERTSLATTNREFLRVVEWDMAPLIDQYGTDREYTLSVDLKADKEGNVNIYSQNGYSTRYSIGTTGVKATKEWQRFYIVFKPTLSNKNDKNALLAFYGTYGTGVIPHVRKAMFTIGNVRKEWQVSSRDLTTKSEFSTFEATMKGFQTTVNSDITGLQSQQTQMDGQISSTIEKVDNIRVGVWNRLVESNKPHEMKWVATAGVSGLLVSKKEIIDGVKVITFNKTQTNSTTYQYFGILSTGIHKPFNMKANKKWSLSFRYYSNKADGEISPRLMDGTGLNYNIEFPLIKIKKGWNLITLESVVTRELPEENNMLYFTTHGLEAGTEFSIDWIVMSPGTVKVDNWVQSPEDNASKSEVIQLSDQITQTVNKVETVDGKVTQQQSQITQLSNNISLKVDKDNVIAQINLSPESIRLDAKFIHLSGKSLIDDAVIKTAHIDNLAVTGAKIQDATISSAKIISLDADKINASTLSSITSNTGQLNVTGWLDFTTDNRGLRGTYDFGDPYNDAFNYRWFDGTFRLSHRHLFYGGYIHDVNPDNTKGVRRGSAETYYGLDYIKLRSWGPQNNMLGQVDISSQYFRMSTGFNDPVGILFNPAGGSYFGASMVVNGDVELRGDTAIKAYTLQARDLTNNVYINQGRPDLADFRVGRDGSNINNGRVIQSLAIYNRTYSGPANMIVYDTGTIGRTTSARKYKLEIETASSVIANAKKVLSLNPKSWFDKGEVLDGVANSRYFGFIADEFDESGLNEVVIYNECGEVESLAYDRISMYHNVILTDHEKEIKMLNRKIETLEERLYARKI